MKPLKLIITLAILSAVIFALAACKKQQKNSYAEMLIISTTQASAAAANQPAAAEATDSEIPPIDTYIILDDEKTTINGHGASFSGNTLTVSEGGVYQLKGRLTDGRIFINSANEAKKVRLVLSGVSISCSTDAPLYVEKSPDETVLILEKGTENYFSDTSRAVPEGKTDYATATVYAKDSLRLEGSGSLTVYGNFNKGIFSKKDIGIYGGSITVIAVDDGIRGKNGVEIEAGSISITCGGDGIRTNKKDKDKKGNIDINGGTISITSELDAIQATGSLTVSGGTLSATSGSGAESNSNNSEYEDGFPFMPGRHPESSRYDENESDTPSTKGIKADKKITVSSGTLTLNSLDDTVHAPEVIINGGNFSLSSDDDGIHADEKLTVNGGKVSVLRSYEGIESRLISINGGELIINADDDGFNAASPDTSEETAQQERNFPMKPGGPGGMMGYDSTCSITMTEGFVLINAQGDGIDSNGSVNMSGGKMIVFGPTMGANGALDYGGSFTVSGGTLFACGALGMAQSVTGNGVSVLNFNVDGDADSFYAISDSTMSCRIAFTAPKSFQNVVFASDTLSPSAEYSLYTDGTVLSDSEIISGICFGGTYTAGALLGQIK